MSAGKILVVDDEPQIRRVMRVILAGENYEVMEARSGEAALLRFREFLPDLVLLDLNMPGMSGLETCRSIRDTSDVPVIVLTIRREEEEKVEASMQARTTTSPSRLANRNCLLAFAPLYDDRPPRRLPGRAHPQRATSRSISKHERSDREKKPFA